MMTSVISLHQLTIIAIASVKLLYHFPAFGENAASGAFFFHFSNEWLLHVQLNSRNLQQAILTFV
jgi:hypothetical protein